MTVRISLLRRVTGCAACCKSQQFTFSSVNNSRRYFYDELNLSNMPKDKRQHILQQKLMRMRTKIKSQKFPSSTVSLTVIGSGVHGASCSLYVSTDHIKYMFNCGEGTQRLAYEHKLKLAKIEHLFVTNPNWRNLGGMPGMVLTLQGEGVSTVLIHGPPRSIDIFNAMKKFVAVNDLEIKEAQCAENNPFDDSIMKVWYVPIVKPSTSDTKEAHPCTLTLDDTDYYAYGDSPNGKRKLHTDNWTNKVPRTMESFNKKSVMCYICKVHEKQSTLSMEACVERNVPPGPLLGQLKAGKDVTLSDGTLVKSSDVCTRHTPVVFLVVECPSMDYLDSFVTHPAFANHQATAPVEADVAKCIVHFTPKEIMDNPKYRDWMRKFSKSTEHLVINEENTDDPCSESIYRHQEMLHLVHPEIFPQLGYKPIDEKAQDRLKKESDLVVYQGKTLLSYDLRPEQGLSAHNLVTIKPTSYTEEALQVDGFLEALSELKTQVNSRVKSLTDTSTYPSFVMLGTGSAIPNKVRNTSAILFRIREDTSILFDCGEGTWGQMMRFYGAEKAMEILSTIKAVSISHLHADHHVGLIGLLQTRKRVSEKPLYLLAPEPIKSWLTLYDQRVEEILDQFVLIPNNAFLPNNIPLEVKSELYKALDIEGISTVHVFHCPFSYGTSVTLKDGRKIVYSGDTMPCKRLVELGKGCTLLIHEATFEDGLEYEAKIKRHSTLSQAINVGQSMEAEFILLTHFSQRYAKLPPLSEDEALTKNVGVAFDNMHFSLSQLPLLPLFHPCLKVLFQEALALLQRKTEYRQRSEQS